MAKPKVEAEAPAVDLLGQLTVELDGAVYTLRPSRQAISNIEEQTGRPLMSLAAQATGLSLPVSDAGICVAEMMKAYAAFDPEASADYRGANADRCADLIFESNSLTLQSRLGAIFKNALTGGYTSAGEPKPER